MADDGATKDRLLEAVDSLREDVRHLESRLERTEQRLLLALAPDSWAIMCSPAPAEAMGVKGAI